MKDIYEQIEGLEGLDDSVKAKLINGIKNNVSNLNDEAKGSREEMQAFKAQLEETRSSVKAMAEAMGKNTEGDVSEIDVNTITHEMKSMKESLSTIQKEKEIAQKEAVEQKKSLLMKDIFVGADIAKDLQSDALDLYRGRYQVNSDGDFVTKEGVPMSDDLGSQLENKEHWRANPVKGGAGAGIPKGEFKGGLAEAKTPVERVMAVARNI